MWHGPAPSHRQPVPSVCCCHLRRQAPVLKSSFCSSVWRRTIKCSVHLGAWNAMQHPQNCVYSCTLKFCRENDVNGRNLRATYLRPPGVVCLCICPTSYLLKQSLQLSACIIQQQRQRHDKLRFLKYLFRLHGTAVVPHSSNGETGVRVSIHAELIFVCRRRCAFLCPPSSSVCLSSVLLIVAPFERELLSRRTFVLWKPPPPPRP